MFSEWGGKNLSEDNFCSTIFFLKAEYIMDLNTKIQLCFASCLSRNKLQWGMTYCAIVMDAEQNEINLMAAYETGTDSSEMSRCSPGS